MHIEVSSVDSIIIYFSQTISSEILDEVQNAYYQLKKLEHIIAITPSYNSILVHYDILKYDHQSIQKVIKKTLSNKYVKRQYNPNKLIEISVDYSQNLDLERVATLNGLTIQEVINQHTQPIYRVYAIGFMVGFAYLAKVNQAIITPRLETPRAKVPQGSVAIADNQTAIYPKDSAGGWNIIGHTDFNEFRHFKIGDSVRFIDARV